MTTDDHFVIKDAFADLEIQTKDDNNNKLYVSKGWLVHFSPYFVALFKGKFIESTANTIKLSYNYKILLILFRCLHNLCVCANQTELENLTTVEEVHEFLSAVNEYQLTSIKTICDDYFSSEAKLNSFYSVTLMNTIVLFSMTKMKKTLNEMIKTNLKMMDEVKIEDMTCITLLFYLDWHLLLSAFEKWSQIHDPTDDELLRVELDKMNWEKAGITMLKNIYSLVKTFTNAPKFQRTIYEKILGAYMI